MEKRCSAILLSGGRSSRMGKNKAELDFHGVSFLQHQADKLRAAGIEDIVVAGSPNAPALCRCVPDVWAHRGPLGGIHAGLLAIREPRALVLAVDTPLVPVTLLKELMKRHKNGITVVSCRELIEPLIGVYDKALSGMCEEILRGEDTSLRKLFQTVGVSTLEYTGDASLLMNCNTPEEYDRLIAL